MTPVPLAFVDVETTGLDPDLHQIWEVALILRTPDGDQSSEVWQLAVDLGRADPMALSIGRFHERRFRRVTGRRTQAEAGITPLDIFATQFAALTRGAWLVGCVPSFDEERLRKLLKANGACPEWNYHLLDMESMAAGKLKVAPPWKSHELSLGVGVDPEDFERHSALGDAKWAAAMYDAVMA